MKYIECIRLFGIRCWFLSFIIVCLLLLGNGLVNIPTATNTHAIIEELLDMFSILSLPYQRIVGN
jgi:hypothetical protein